MLTDDFHLKDKTLNLKISKRQKEIIDQMAKERQIKVSRLIIRLLENELKNPTMEVYKEETKNGLGKK